MISVIVPIYKVEPYLDKCIASIVNQSYQNLEILLVDDGSPDRCGEICDAWALRDARICVIHKANGGLSDARNTGIDAAHGEYLAFVDSDDSIAPDMLENLYEAIRRDKAEIAVCGIEYVNENALVMQRLRFPQKIVLSGSVFLTQMHSNDCVLYEAAWNKLYRASLFRGLRYPVGRLHEDEFLIHHLAYPCRRISCIDYVGYSYLQRSGSITQQAYSVRQRLDFIDALIERAYYMIEHNEKELSLFCEDTIFVNIKKLQNSSPKKSYRSAKKEARRIEKKLFFRRWITFFHFAKRWYRFRFL